MRDRDLVQELLDGFAAAYAGAKRRESALDFEDLQLVARDVLRDHPELRDREATRFRAIMVDEFQDTNRLQCDLIDLLADAPGRARRVLRRRRVPVDLRLPPCGRPGLPRAPGSGGRRPRARPQLPVATRGARRRQPPLPRRLRRRLPAADRLRRVPRSGLRPAGGAARDRQVELFGLRDALAPCRSAAHRCAASAS